MDYSSFQPSSQSQNQESTTSSLMESIPRKTITPKFIGVIVGLLILGAGAYGAIWYWQNQRTDVNTIIWSGLLQIYDPTVVKMPGQFDFKKYGGFDPNEWYLSPVKSPILASSSVWQGESYKLAKNNIKLKFTNLTKYYICDDPFYIDSSGYVIYNWQSCHAPTNTFRFGEGSYVRVFGHQEADSFVVEKMELELY